MLYKVKYLYLNINFALLCKVKRSQYQSYYFSKFYVKSKSYCR